MSIKIKYIERLLSYIQLGDLEKIKWCIQKDNIDLNDYYRSDSLKKSNMNFLAYVVLHESIIPQAEDIIELMVNMGGNLYVDHSAYHSSNPHWASPFLSHLINLNKRDNAKEKQDYDEEGIIQKIFKSHLSRDKWDLQNATREAFEQARPDWVDFLLNNGADTTDAWKRPPEGREPINHTLVESLRYEAIKKDQWDRQINIERLAPCLEVLERNFERQMLEKNIPESHLKTPTLRL